MLTPNEWLPAKLKWYSISRGYGFVKVHRPDSKPRDAFLHARTLRDRGVVQIPENINLMVRCSNLNGKLRVIDIQMEGFR